jgi:hypothetical protein
MFGMEAGVLVFSVPVDLVMRTDVEQYDFLFCDAQNQDNAVFIGQPHRMLSPMYALQWMQMKPRRPGIRFELSKHILEDPFQIVVTTQELPGRSDKTIGPDQAKMARCVGGHVTSLYGARPSDPLLCPCEHGQPSSQRRPGVTSSLFTFAFMISCDFVFAPSFPHVETDLPGRRIGRRHQLPDGRILSVFASL